MKRPRWGVVCLAILIGGCTTVGPDYNRPTLEAPSQWESANGISAPSPALASHAWWKGFDDPILNRLIVQASRENLDLAQARARIAQARAALLVAGAAEQPTVNVKGTITRNATSENLPSATPSITSTMYQAGFDATWELDVFGGTRRSIESAQARLDVSVEDLHSAQLTLLGDVARNYIVLRANQAQLQITCHNLEVQQETVKVTRERYALGLASYLDVTQAEAQKTTTDADIPSLKAAIKQSIHRLGILSGKKPTELDADLSAAQPMPPAKGLIVTGLPSELLSRRPDLRLAERQLAAASADIGVATAGLYPTFDLTLGLGLQASNSSKLLEKSSRYWSIAPGVFLPLFDGGKIKADIEGRQAVYDETFARYRLAYNSALEDVENALTAYYAEHAKNRILADSVHINEESVALALDRYRRGLTSFLDVLTTQRALYNAQSSLSQSDANRLIDLISLYKALGGGWDLSDGENSSAASP